MWSKQEYQLITVGSPALNANGLMGGELKDWIDEFLAQGKKHIILDLSEVLEVSSMGLGAIVSVHKKVTAQAGFLKIIGVRDQVATTFRLAEVRSVLEIYIRL